MNVFSLRIRKYEEVANNDHGRIEQRKIKVMDMPWEYQNGWQTIAQIAKLTRYRWSKKHGDSTEIAIFITSLDKNQCSAKRLLELNRGHWSIENTLHWTRDKVFCEDASTLRKGNSPRANATFNSLAIHIIKKSGRKITEALETFADNKNLAMKLII